MDSCKGHSVSRQLYAAESSTLFTKRLAVRADALQFTLLIDFHGKLRAPDAYRVSVRQPTDSACASACSKVLGGEGSLGRDFPSGVRDSSICWRLTITISVIMHEEIATTDRTFGTSVSIIISAAATSQSWVQYRKIPLGGSGALQARSRRHPDAGSIFPVAKVKANYKCENVSTAMV